MKLKVKVTKEVEAEYLQVEAGVRYWEDAIVNGVEDSDGKLIPLRSDDQWCPLININTGHILKWPKGVVAKIHYKVCDDGAYEVLDSELDVLIGRDGYVPNILCPGGDGFGDYIIMNINTDGFIENWKPNLSDFMEGDTSV